MDKQNIRRVYADCAATAPLSDAAKTAMEPYFETGNPSSSYKEGREASRALFGARRRCAEALGCTDREIVFTSGGTEANNFAIKGLAFAKGLRGHIVCTAIEHSSVLKSLDFLRNFGMEVTNVRPNADGTVSPDNMARAMRDDTVLCVCMLANNEIGTVQPVSEITALAHKRGIPVFCDAVQAIGQIPVSVCDLGVDMLSVSGHKIGAMRGTGLLYVRRGIKLFPLIDGGGQEMGLRSGTENTAGNVGLAAALTEAVAYVDETAAHLQALSDALFERLLRLPHCVLNGTGERGKRLPGNVNVSFFGCDAEQMVSALDRMGISASAGSACTAGKTQPSYVLKALGADDARATSSLRFTLGRDNTREDVEEIAACVARMTARFYEGK